jgi:hypothetical protein
VDPFYKLYAEIDLASLHYVTFIKLLVDMPTESLSFGSEQFMNNSINKLIEEKINDPFLLLEKHYFATVLLHNKTYGVQFEILLQSSLILFRTVKWILYDLCIIKFTTSSLS